MLNEYRTKCRSVLTPYIHTDGKPKYWGRFNQGVVTINLPDVALSADGDTSDFWSILDERLELVHRTLQIRHERLKLIKASNAPTLWMHGGIARLEDPDATIEEYLYNGYSTISLGFAGLYECVKGLLGVSHTTDEGYKLAKDIMQVLNDKCATWKAEENIDYSVYGTPLESTTYKFARALQRRFGVIEGLTDKEYITNSYHIHVTEEIDAFSKLKFESEFQELSPGGAISYVETSDLTRNIPAVLALMKYIYNNIMYAELNTRSDYCQDCGYSGAIDIVKGNSNEWIWQCPNCLNRDRSRMNIAIRVCGYIGTNESNQGRTGEYAERVEHLSIPLDFKVTSNEPVVIGE